VKAGDQALPDRALNPVVDSRWGDADAFAQFGERQTVVILQKRQKLAVGFVELSHGFRYVDRRLSLLGAVRRLCPGPSGNMRSGYGLRYPCRRESSCAATACRAPLYIRHIDLFSAKYTGN
jgi:hypothetical protein